MMAVRFGKLQSSDNVGREGQPRREELLRNDGQTRERRRFTVNLLNIYFTRTELNKALHKSHGICYTMRKNRSDLSQDLLLEP